MSTKRVTLVVGNSTSVDFYRHLHTLHHATWTLIPAERIAAKHSMTCSAEGTAPLSALSGKLQYSCVLHGIEYVVGVSFGVPVLGDRKEKAFLASSPNVKEAGLPPAAVLFILSAYADKRDPSRHHITIAETREGSEYIKKLRDDSVTMARQPAYRINRPGRKDAVVSHPSDTQRSSFVPNIKNHNWKKQLRRAHRSIMIRIVNLTRNVMRLMYKDGSDLDRRPQMFLEDGVWVEYPRDEICPMGCSEFGARSRGFMQGTQGKVYYTMPGHPGWIIFSWEQPYVGVFKSQGGHSTNKFSVQTHTDRFNECTLLFHVLDPMKPPPLRIISAKAVHSHNGEQYDRHRRGPPKGDDCTTHVSAAVKCIKGSTRASMESMAMGTDTDDGSGEMVLELTNPRSFFASLNTGRKWYNPASWLFIEWQIGCERFSSIWPSEDRVRIKPSLVGGGALGRQQGEENCVILDAEVVPNWQWYPERLLLLNGPGAAGGGGPSTGGKKAGGERGGGRGASRMFSGSAGGRSDHEGASQEQLLEAVVSCLQLLSEGLQPVVTQHMKNKFGDGWLAKCGLPKGHVWRDSANPSGRVDVEGLLNIMHAFWFDVFENIIRNPQVIHQLQGVAIYWATQDLSKFDDSYVFLALETAAELLRGLNQYTHASSIDTLCHSLFEAGPPDSFDNASPSTPHTATGNNIPPSSLSSSPSSSTVGISEMDACIPQASSSSPPHTHSSPNVVPRHVKRSPSGSGDGPMRSDASEPVLHQSSGTQRRRWQSTEVDEPASSASVGEEVEIANVEGDIPGQAHEVDGRRSPYAFATFPYEPVMRRTVPTSHEEGDQTRPPGR
ncbi:unnamed protein product [Vitrella brassicaformis CCMP3155]|uniref:Swt1-like HEPN domain-containing protein n=3 Tax=Vitrella brassicaformis TaxID=1169539 RepID=A0A0G4ENW1_VITBC|nr:unnamed protein product [Vitrella brassicaformis CCMP3155]|eukprot:CEL99032.1 unnamed protein product [Vitrella brassicaformis CCMP3155]